MPKVLIADKLSPAAVAVLSRGASPHRKVQAIGRTRIDSETVGSVRSLRKLDWLPMFGGTAPT